MHAYIHSTYIVYMQYISLARTYIGPGKRWRHSMTISEGKFVYTYLHTYILTYC